MKKKHLYKLLKKEQQLLNRALKIVLSAYKSEYDSAEDEGPPVPALPGLNPHKAERSIPQEFERFYQ